MDIAKIFRQASVTDNKTRISESTLPVIGEECQTSLYMMNMDGSDPKGNLVILIEDEFLVQKDSSLEPGM